MSDDPLRTAVYGSPPPDLADVPPGATQLSPLVPASTAIESLPDGGLDTIVVAAPPGSMERRFVLAHALRALRVGGRIVALAPKDRGGQRLSAELAALGCEAAQRSKAHHRICEGVRSPGTPALAEAIAEGAPRMVEGLGLWSQPGVFSFDRIDPGSAVLLDHLSPVQGRGADLGAGIGVLSRAILAFPQVEHLDLVEIDRRAVEVARRNIADLRAAIHWADVREFRASSLDFVISNPPFHAEGTESRALGQDFIRAAAAMLRKGGRLVLVANRHLPYEAVLAASFAATNVLAEACGYKVIEARR